MAHKDVHPEHVEGCFGCKVLTIGYDSKTMSGTQKVRATPERLGATVTEHRDGRVDTTVHAPRVSVRTSTTEN